MHLTVTPRRDIVKQFAMRLVRDEQGQDLIEYGLLIGIITVGAIAAILAIGPKVANYFSTLNSSLP
jgi:pilus assembly protein Flp/PilA